MPRMRRLIVQVPSLSPVRPRRRSRQGTAWARSYSAAHWMSLDCAMMNGSSGSVSSRSARISSASSTRPWPMSHLVELAYDSQREMILSDLPRRFWQPRDSGKEYQDEKKLKCQWNSPGCTSTEKRESESYPVAEHEPEDVANHFNDNKFASPARF
jgi:hypothetical protein